MILIEISKPDSVHPDLPTLSVEMWFPTTDKTQRIQEELTQIAVDWTMGIPGPLRIPLCTLLGSTEVPEGLPVEHSATSSSLYGPSKPLYSISPSFSTDAYSVSNNNDSIQHRSTGSL